MIAILAAGFGFSLGGLLRIVLLDALRHLHPAPSPFGWWLWALLRDTPANSLLVLLFAGLPTALAATCIFRWRLSGWHHFLAAGFLVMLACFAFIALRGGRLVAYYAIELFGGGMVAGALIGSLAPWFYLRAIGQLPSRAGRVKARPPA